MLQKLSIFSLMAALCMIVSGCAQIVYPSEALQMKEGAKVYTACNIWYEDPADINALNYHKGKILPFGTEIEFVEVTKSPKFFPNEAKIVFKDLQGGQQYRINYDQTWMLFPVEEYIRRMFTTKNIAEQTTGISSADVEKLKRGIVEEGMTRKEVLLAYGYPVPHRTPAITDDTWIFWNEKLDSVRVVFQKDKVLGILKIE